MKTIVIADIHGRYLELMTLLDRLSFLTGSDRLVILGDTIDYGPNSKLVVDFLMEMKNPRNIYIAGNHEDAVVRAWRGLSRRAEFLDMDNDGQTAQSYGRDKDEVAERSRVVCTHQDIAELTRWIFGPYHLHFFLKMLPYAWLDGIYLCHGGLTYGLPVPDHTPEMLLWGDEKWVKRRAHGSQPVVICGHWHNVRPVIAYRKIILATMPRLCALVLDELTIVDDTGKRISFLPEYIGL